MKGKSAVIVRALFPAFAFPGAVSAFDTGIDPRFLGGLFCGNNAGLYTFNADGSASAGGEDFADTGAARKAIDGIPVPAVVSAPDDRKSASCAVSGDDMTILLKQGREGVRLHKNSPGGGVDPRIAGGRLCENGGSAFVFNADGKGIVKEGYKPGTEFIYRAAGGIPVMNRDDGENIRIGVSCAVSGGGAALIPDMNINGLPFRKKTRHLSGTVDKGPANVYSSSWRFSLTGVNKNPTIKRLPKSGPRLFKGKT